jgi:uncharacterized membrane protein
MAHCNACGASIPAAPQIPGEVFSERAACALAYALWALSGVLFLVIEPYNRSRMVRFHAFQSIYLSLAIFAGWFAALLTVLILRLIPIAGPLVAPAIIYAFGLAVLGVWIGMILRTLQGVEQRLPLIGTWAAKTAQSAAARPSSGSL